MTAKDYLSQVRRATVLIRLKQREIDKLQQGLEYKAVNYEVERVQSSANDRTDLICKLLDFEHELKEQIKELVNLKGEIIKTIDTIKDTDLIEVLYLRYLECMQWEEIALKMNYSYRWILKLHGQALLKIEKILNRTY